MESTKITLEDKDKFSAVMTLEYMSSEHAASSSSDSDNAEQSEGEASNPKVLLKQSLPWRSDEAHQLMASLDRRIRKRRGQKGQSKVIERKQGSGSLRPDVYTLMHCNGQSNNVLARPKYKT